MIEATWLMLSLAAVTNFLGCLWLALSLEAHWRQVHQCSEPPKLFLRAFGVLMLLSSGFLSLQADRASIAVLVWCMWFAVSIPLTAALLTWRPLWLRLAWPRW